MSEQPFISICTPLFNRTKWLPLMKFNIKHLDYPKNKIEWCILDTYDNKSVPWDKLFKSEKEIKEVEEELGIKINYKMNSNAYKIGCKRNMIIKQSNHKLIANMDSDDIMLPCWLKHSLEIMNSDKRCTLVGTPEMTFVFPHYNYKITGIRCPQKRMMHEAGMVYTKKHWKAMGGYGKSSSGEGTKLVDFNENKCLKTSADKVIICVCHDENTIDKERFKDKSANNICLGGPLKDVLEKIFA